MSAALKYTLRKVNEILYLNWAQQAVLYALLTAIKDRITGFTWIVFTTPLHSSCGTCYNKTLYCETVLPNRKDFQQELKL